MHIPKHLTHTRPSALIGVLVVLLASSLSKSFAASDIYIPGSDEEIVAELPSDVVEIAAHVRSSTNQAATAANIDPQQQFLQIIDSYRLASASNSPRAYGRTLALIESWPAQTELPPMLRLIKADVLQHNHDFDRALTELDRLLASDPRNLSALQMMSQIHLVRGNYTAAQQSCSTLEALNHKIVALNCQAQLDGVSGKAAAALARIESVLQSQVYGEQDRLELNITAASIAHRLGDKARAEFYYTNALRLQPDSDYMLIQYADWLLERGRARDAVKLLTNKSDDDNRLELQLVYSQALLQSREQQDSIEPLTRIHETIAIMDRRIEERPSKLLARYYLTIAHDYEAAHSEALRNWQVQREPSDSWLLARSAAAAGQQESLEQLRNWYHTTGQEDYRVEKLLAEHGVSK